MSDQFQMVKNYISELGFDISKEVKEDEVVIINDESKGISLGP